MGIPEEHKEFWRDVLKNIVGGWDYIKLKQYLEGYKSKRFSPLDFGICNVLKHEAFEVVEEELRSRDKALRREVCIHG